MKLIKPNPSTILILLFLGSTAYSQEEWTQYRGPHRNGSVATNVQLTEAFDLENDIAWASDIPGTGWSSPVLIENRIWVTTAIVQTAKPAEDAATAGPNTRRGENRRGNTTVELRAICVDADLGVILHNVLLANVSNPDIIHPLNSYASPTPACSQGLVVCHFGSFGTWCLDGQTGATLWQRKFEIDHGVGPGSSPIIFEDHVILVCDGIDKQFIASVDLQSGKDRWITNRPPLRAADPDNRKSYCTPFILELESGPQAIIPGAQWIVGYDPRTGQELWRADHGDGFSLVPMPLLESGLIIFATGYMKPEFVAIDPTGSGDVTQTHIRWRAKNAPTMSSFIGFEGRIYAVNETGILFCLDAANGEILARSRIGGNYSASPLRCQNRLYLFSREGYVSILECSPEFTQIARVNLDSPVMASPAVLGNDLIVRTKDKLLRVRGAQR